ncbi:MAG: hypothetical protein HKN40_02680 [Winogradskyella sp.]|uniref:hypothetical protein n=1 Tax=Winogradskyella sp. TaxID=1883156 RepID=UPI0017C0A954|nr:hypothetical protein [Winogradskyella sp.]
MAKKSNPKRLLKIFSGVLLFFTLPALLFFGFIYLKYNEDLPVGKQGPKADQLASKMLTALNEDAYLNTNYLEWTFKNRHHYKWYKTDNICEVFWADFRVVLDLNNTSNSEVYVAQQAYNGVEKSDYIDKAKDYFNNDSFWLVAPYKVFDMGTERRLVKTEEGKEALLVTYTTGGTTPGDSYLWHLDSAYKPISFQMWVNILPIQGLEATWEGWITTESGAQLPTLHKMLVIALEIDKVKGIRIKD